VDPIFGHHVTSGPVLRKQGVSTIIQSYYKNYTMEEVQDVRQEEEEHTLCGICLEAVLAKDQIFLRGCHVHNGDFHEDCVAKWVHEQTEEQKVEPRCPTCRQHIPKGQTRDLMVRGITLRYPDGRPQEENPFSVEFVGGFQARRAARRADIERLR
jgi:hypothetical protein